MDIFFTLDYELFLGKKCGSVDNCLIRPLEEYTNRTKQYGVKFTLFVDAAFLYKLKELGHKFPHLLYEYKKISEHIKWLQKEGHDIQLHIHPQWFYSFYNGTTWEIDKKHYKLSDIQVDSAKYFFKVSKECLENIIEKKVIAFRAGGFCAQPIPMLTSFFYDNDIKIDSSVCPGMKYSSEFQNYDYSGYSTLEPFLFSSQICECDPNGQFIEIPISTCRISPFFYWKLILSRLSRHYNHVIFGDGESVSTTIESIGKRLISNTIGLVTIDGYKIKYLEPVYSRYKNENKSSMVIIGHPKLATLYSVNSLEKFCSKTYKKDTFTTVSDYYQNLIK